MTEPSQELTQRDRPGRGLQALWSTGWPIGALVAIFVVIDQIVLRITDLGEAGYTRPSLILESMTRLGLAVPVLLALWGIALWRTGSFGLRWPGFERGWSFRLPVGAAVVLLTWWFSTYEYNLFLDRAHLFDRLVLILLGALTLWRPVFAVPWLLVVTTIIQQFQYPIGGYSVAEQYQLVRVVELFIALMVIRLIVGRWRNADFVVVLVCLVAGAYWVPGVGKARLGWLQVGAHVEKNLFSSYAYGWLGSLSTDTVSSVGRFLRPLAWPMLIGTAVVEFGAVFILWSRRNLVGWLGLFIAFHLGVMALTGIFFWRWIVLEVALLAFLLRHRLLASLPTFTWSHALIGTGLVVTAPLWSMPVNLAWLDAPVAYAYRFVATDASGQTGELAPGFFRPFDYQFSLAGFDYLSADTKLLPHYWGAVGTRDLLEELYDADSASEVLQVEAELGTVLFDEERAADFDRFVTTFVSNWNDHPDRGALSALQPPPQLWTYRPDPYRGNGPIVTVTVWRTMTYWDGDEFGELRTTRVREIEIGAGP